ncbi:MULTISPECIES: hypothetical protein [unclassified Caulobacter]|uniref:antitoxin Xre/MbcA/ParS-like domain-containing protein n=1 Tax=unclassified Caulobacter TaxID=2648921 RepID=UPI000A9522EC|nr:MULTISPECIES: hypothetical protein [unclassified Caulobacter]
MSTSPARRRPAASDNPLGLDPQQLVALLSKSHPRLSPRRLAMTGQALSAAAYLTTKLTEAQQAALANDVVSQDRVLKAMREILAETSATTARPENPSAMRGEGLGALLSLEEGQRRLSAYAEPMKLEDWAGPVAGSTELRRDYGIARSSLHAWQQQGAVVGLLKGRRAHVFPIAQFIDARPVEGLTSVLTIIREPRTAWLWLISPHPELDEQTPLAQLKAGKVREIADLAARDYGQP